MEKTNLENLNRLARLFGTDRLISPEDIEAIRDSLIGVLANNKKEIENLTDETKQAVNSILDKVLNEHDTYLEKTKQIAQEAKSETTEAINSTLKSLEEVKALCKEVMECKPENGEDADEEYVIGEVLNRIKLPEYKEIVLDDGGAIVDKINSLPVNEENQIDAKHIKNLPLGKDGRVISGGMTKTRVQQMIDASGGSPGGSTTQLQYNNAGAFGGISGATTDGTAVTFATDGLLANTLKSATSAGTLFESNSGTDVLLLGAGGGAGATFYGGVNIDGSLTVDTNTLYVDATNNRVGVGTVSPTNPLTILTNALGAQLRLGDVAGSQFQYEIGRETAVGRLKFEGFQNNFSGFDFVQNNAGVQTTVLRIAEITGNVGIGVTAPLTKLHLSGGDVSTGFTTATIALGFNTTGQYPHFIHTRHNGGPTSNAIDFYTSDGTAAGVYPTNAIHGMTISNAQIGLQTTAPTHTLTLGSTGTGIALYNTADQTTNYERGQIFWNSNAFTISSTKAGSGADRSLILSAGASNQSTITLTRASLPVINLNSGVTSLTGNLSSFTLAGNATSGTQVFTAFTPTLTQTGTAGYTALLVNPTETTTGSGTKLLADFQVGGSSKASINNTGAATLTGTATTLSGTGSLLTGLRISGVGTRYIGVQVQGQTISDLYFGRDHSQDDFIVSRANQQTNELFRITNAGLVGIGLTPTAVLHLKAGTATASTAPLKFTAGTDLTAPEAGTMEFSNSETGLTFTAVSTRRAVVLDTATQTLTNKFITPQVQSVADAGGTLTPVSITNDIVIATALSQATTIAAPTGSPVQGEKLTIRLKDNGTARALTWNAIYRAIGVTLPTTTVISKIVYVGCIYNSTDTKWDVVSVAQEA